MFCHELLMLFLLLVNLVNFRCLRMDRIFSSWQNCPTYPLCILVTKRITVAILYLSKLLQIMIKLVTLCLDWFLICKSWGHYICYFKNRLISHILIILRGWRLNHCSKLLQNFNLVKLRLWRGYSFETLLILKIINAPDMLKLIRYKSS